MNKDLFRAVGNGGQLFFLLFFLLLGLIFAGIVSALVLALGGLTDISALSVDMLKVLQTLQAFFMFFLPACFCAYLFHESAWDYLKVKEPIPFNHIVLIVAIMFSIQPFISLVGYYNDQMVFPEALSGLESYLKEAESMATQLTSRFLSDNTTWGFLSAMFVVALVAAICEEFFFRGVLLQIFKRLFRNIHVAVWISAVIFSAIHFQFYGFVPRVLLGALLGYIFIWTGSIWGAVLAHFVNNAFAVVIHHFYSGTPTYDILEKFGTGDTWGYSLGGFVIAVFFVYLLRKTSRPQNKGADAARC
jgi:membrane protease YdiL (CAAX protease family)